MNPNGGACQCSTKPWCIGVSRLDSSSADIEEAYLEAIGAANEKIILAAAYFFPGVRFCHALVNAAARGVRVMLLLQARVECVLLHYALRAIRTALAASEYFILFASERAAQSASPRAPTQACR